MSINDERWEEYFIPGTDVLKNRLDITDKKKLLKEEANITLEKSLKLQFDLSCLEFDSNETKSDEVPVYLRFNEEHLKAIHRYLFGDIYYFAGEYRTVYMEKNHSYFAAVEDIPFRLREAFRVAEEDLKMIQYDSSGYGFASLLTGLYVELLNIHPFREGNGRTIREFIREYANEKSKQLPFGEINFCWSNVDKEEINRYIDKAIVFRSNIESEFMKAFEKVENVNHYNR